MTAYVELERILPNPWQTRGEPNQEHIQALADDIDKNGLLQRPVGRLLKDGQPVEINLLDAISGSGDLVPVFQVQLAFGHNRLAAFKLLDGKEPKTIFQRMPVDIYWLDDEKMAQAAWSENERRRDLTPMERARAIQKRMADFGWNQKDTALRLELSEAAVSNILRLLELPENIQEALGNGELSERCAMALLPLYDVPAEILDSQRYMWNGPEKIVEEALDGASSEAIRKKVNDYFSRTFQSLHESESEVKISKVFQEGGAIYCGTCQACDKRIASRNLCMDRQCFEAKVQATRHKYLEKASLASGYAIIDESKGGYPSTLPDYPERLEKILATKCSNLRVAYDLSGGNRDDPRRIDGHKKAILVCDKRNDSCTCRKALEKIERDERENGRVAAPVILADFVPEDLKEAVGDVGVSPEAEAIFDPAEHGAALVAPTPAELEGVMRKARQDKRDATEKQGEIRRMLVELLMQALADHEPGALYVLVKRYTWPRDNQIDLQSVYREGAHDIAQHIMPGSFESVDDLVRKTNQVLERLGLPLIRLEKTLAEVFADET